MWNINKLLQFNENDCYCFEFINNRYLPNNYYTYILISLDVVPLFRWNLLEHHCNITQIKIIKFIFDINRFSFNNTFYKQTFGTLEKKNKSRPGTNLQRTRDCNNSQRKQNKMARACFQDATQNFLEEYSI